MFIVFIDSPVARRRFMGVKNISIIVKNRMGKACADNSWIDNSAKPER